MTPGVPAGEPRATRSEPIVGGLAGVRTDAEQDKEQDKQSLRQRLRTARSARVVDSDASARLASAVLDLVGGAEVVAAYVSRPDEPSTTLVLDRLWTGGVRVLLPVLRTEPQWADYRGPGSLRPGPLGIGAPTGTPLPADALAEASVILLPGLAGTASGDRLGTGGGWYDRALAFAAADAVTALLLFDDEVLDTLPLDPWDRPVQILVTSERTVRCLPGDR